ncbi:MAG: hypothetical protein ACPHDM_02945, partial [Candidatus Poseidoniaceae archaeon]
GIPILVTVEVTNSGNGAETAILDLPWSSNSWDWWALIDGTNVTQGIPLSVSYDLENVKMVDVWIILPSLEAPGEFHEITISVEPLEGQDINSSDNAVMFEAITETIRQPRLDGFVGESVVETNSTFSFNATAWNIGNAADYSIRARLVLQTSPPTQEVIGFLSTANGLSKSSGEWINLNLGATESIDLFADVIISSDCDLNTIISATIELEGGMDNIGRPISKTVAAALIVGERRNVELQDIPRSDDLIKPGSSEVFWVNLTSTSTQSEIFEVTAISPNGWGVICDGNTIHISSTRIEMGPGHLTVQKHDMRCEIIRESGEYSGDVTILINGSDSRIMHVVNQQVTWEKPITEEGVSTMVVASGIGGFIALAAIVFFIQRRGDDYDEDDEYDTSEYTEEIPIQGPPATAFAGPPATAHVESDPMEEYQKQLEEYNRKMAEYQAWQHAQGSQVTDDTTAHE